MPGVKPLAAQRVARHRDHRAPRLGRIAAAPGVGRQPIAELVCRLPRSVDADAADQPRDRRLRERGSGTQASLRAARARQKRLGIAQRIGPGHARPACVTTVSWPIASPARGRPRASRAAASISAVRANIIHSPHAFALPLARHDDVRRDNGVGREHEKREPGRPVSLFGWFPCRKPGSPWWATRIGCPMLFGRSAIIMSTEQNFAAKLAFVERHAAVGRARTGYGPCPCRHCVPG